MCGGTICLIQFFLAPTLSLTHVSCFVRPSVRLSVCLGILNAPWATVSAHQL